MIAKNRTTNYVSRTLLLVAALVFAGCGESDHDSRVEDLENQKRSLERDIGTSEDTIAKHIKEIEELEHAIESIRK